MLTRESLIDWAASWVPDSPAGQRKRFADALAAELSGWSPPQPAVSHYPDGMGEESRRLHREYNALVEAQRHGANNGAEVVRLTDECAAKGIVLVPGGENL